MFCERSLAIFKSLDLQPLKASMGIAGNDPVVLWMPVFPGRSKCELRSVSCAPHTLVVRLWRCSSHMETDCRGGEGMNIVLGFECSALVKGGVQCSHVAGGSLLFSNSVFH